MMHLGKIERKKKQKQELILVHVIFVPSGFFSSSIMKSGIELRHVEELLIVPEYIHPQRYYVGVEGGYWINETGKYI